VQYPLFQFYPKNSSQAKLKPSLIFLITFHDFKEYITCG
ncbi:unnamed protein product, partial [Brassica oleracea var. botrytis]